LNTLITFNALIFAIIFNYFLFSSFISFRTMLASERGLDEANARIADLQVNTEQNAKQLEVYADLLMFLLFLHFNKPIPCIMFCSNV
jgi:hypothetical protein